MKAKWSIIKSGFILLILLVVLGAAKDLFFQSLLEKCIAQATGLRTRIGFLHVSPLSPQFRIKEILIDNPEGFKERHLARVSEAFMDWRLSDLLKGKRHLGKVQLVIEELFVVTQKGGLRNIDFLLGQIQGRNFSMHIDQLDLTVERVIVKNSEGSRIRVGPFDPMVHHERFENLESLKELIQTVLSKAEPRELDAPPK